MSSSCTRLILILILIFINVESNLIDREACHLARHLFFPLPGKAAENVLSWQVFPPFTGQVLKIKFSLFLHHVVLIIHLILHGLHLWGLSGELEGWL